ncbi:cytochrome-c peroxidase [Aequorivita echinoideorum]|uniref:Cytochrome-c peroxidase n=1 Tax=Aequorivita echinoideorum TaxID=1549647 RepID=A0ABS5S561_9FLAO|nr:cytochrome c peroxidase [Aequorivita echinoideorum]MBT0608357.1 cytochrome-c peroxidase [Aequorivita echinoideorum]
MKKLQQLFIAATAAMFLFASCSKDDGYSGIPEDRPFNFEIPSNFPAMAQDIGNNMPTENGVALGRKLFYENKLSRDNTISCSFCHEQAYAFTHHGHDLSHGIDNLLGIRNAPAVQNMTFQSEYFYDGASNGIQLLSIVPIHNPVEMDESLPSIAAKLAEDDAYVQLFQSAFDDGEISSSNMLNALAQFMTVMISADSKYDKYVRNEPDGNMTQQELDGLSLFQNKCSVCHATDLFTDSKFRNNGLPPNPNLNDLGRHVVTGFENDKYKFKVPSLRNVALTKPYMHDGRFGSLESVLDFYSSGVQETQNLDPILQQNNTLGIPLSEEEKQALIAFLKTLTDETFITNPLFYEQT